MPQKFVVGAILLVAWCL